MLQSMGLSWTRMCLVDEYEHSIYILYSDFKEQVVGLSGK